MAFRAGKFAESERELGSMCTDLTITKASVVGAQNFYVLCIERVSLGGY